MINFESMAVRFSVDSVSNATSCKFELLDQTLLPHEEKWLHIENNVQLIEAIKALRVRGAPLIGVAASFGLAQSAIQGKKSSELLVESQNLYEARPTAVNLMICMERMQKKLTANFSSNELVKTAIDIYNEDIALCSRIAENGAALFVDGDKILTHCNTGSLATAGVGTALGVIRKAHEQGKNIHVYVDETRPLLQGARLTAWELKKLGIPFTLITDNMAGHLMSQGAITKAIVGCDRIAANGDFANKIGTYSVAVLCHYHRIPFYVAGPYTTVDSFCAAGKDIPIEERKANEVLGVECSIDGQYIKIQWAPKNSPTYNPSFDVTPHPLVSRWIMDKAVYKVEDVLNGAFKGA